LAQALDLPLDSEGNLEMAAMNTRNQRRGAQAKAAPVSLGDPKRAASKESAPPVRKGAAKKAVEAAGLPLPPKKSVALLRQGGPRMAFERLFGVDPSVPNDDVLGTIPQALWMMNSPLINTRIAARPGTVLGQILANAPDDRAALNALYLRALSRQPTPQEVEICGRYLAAVGDRGEAFEDIYWSLINSTEFVTRR